MPGREFRRHPPLISARASLQNAAVMTPTFTSSVLNTELNGSACTLCGIPTLPAGCPQGTSETSGATPASRSQWIGMFAWPMKPRWQVCDSFRQGERDGVTRNPHNAA